MIYKTDPDLEITPGRRQEIELYVNYGRPPGPDGFVRHVLRDEFYEAIRHASSVDLAVIGEYEKLLARLPFCCWGDEMIVKRWIAKPQEYRERELREDLE